MSGFSDSVLDVVVPFARGGLNTDHRVGVIEEMQQLWTQGQRKPSGESGATAARG